MGGCGLVGCLAPSTTISFTVHLVTGLPDLQVSALSSMLRELDAGMVMIRKFMASVASDDSEATSDEATSRPSGAPEDQAVNTRCVIIISITVVKALSGRSQVHQDIQ